jgi:HlyD family secretion protein
MPVAQATASGAHHSLREVIDHEQSDRRRRLAIRIVLGVLGVAGVVAAIVVFRPRPVPLAEQLRMEAVGRRTVVREVGATGRVEARASVDVGAQVSGRIARVEVDFNDHVTRGQVLARFDTESLDAQVAQTQASVKAAQAALEQAKAARARIEKRLARSNRLHAQGIESDEAIDELRASQTEADATIKSSAAQLELQRANARVARTSRQYAEVTSPIDGIVISRNVEPGQTVAAAFQTPVLFTIAEDLVAMKVVAAIDEADAGEVVPGQRATFTVDAFPERVFEARVTELRLAAKVIQNVVTYEAVLLVDNPELLLRPGMTASVKVRTAEAADALHVPNAALRFTPPEHADEPRRHTVWVLRDDETVALRVVPGISDGVVTQIDDDGTLRPDDEVIVDLTPVGRKLHEKVER